MCENGQDGQVGCVAMLAMLATLDILGAAGAEQTADAADQAAEHAGLRASRGNRCRSWPRLQSGLRGNRLRQRRRTSSSSRSARWRHLRCRTFEPSRIAVFELEEFLIRPLCAYLAHSKLFHDDMNVDHPPPFGTFRMHTMLTVTHLEELSKLLGTRMMSHPGN